MVLHVGGFCISPRNGVLASGGYVKTSYWGLYRIEIIQGRVAHWPLIIPGAGEWFTWLQRIPSFAFRARARGGAYWIAYRHIGGQLIKHSIGLQAEVTTARLEEIASELEMRAR